MRRLTTRQKNRMTIIEAARRLEANGHKLIGAEQYDLVNKTARYRVILDGDAEMILTPAEIKDLV